MSASPLLALVVSVGGMASLALGYWAGLSPRAMHVPSIDSPRPSTGAGDWANLAILGCALYFALSAARLFDVGGSPPGNLDAVAGYAARQRSLLNDPSAMDSILGLTSVVSLVGVAALVTRRGVRPVRIAAWLAMGVYGIAWVSVGTVKGIADLAVLVGSGFLVLWGRGGVAIQGGRALASSLVVLIGGTAIAGQILGTRLNASPTAGEGRLAGVLGDVGIGLDGLIAYISGGYQGLASTVGVVDWIPTYGLGASPGVAGLLRPLTGLTYPFESTYPARAELATGWPALEKWQTAYPWLASDLSFPGAVVAVALLGIILARSWQSATTRNSLRSTAWFSFAALNVAYIPLNNQAFASSGAAVTICTLSVWSLGSWLRRGRSHGRSSVSCTACTSLPAATETLNSRSK